MSDLGDVIVSRWHNATLSWLLLAVLAGVAAVNLVDGDLLWAGLAATIVAVALVPTALTRDKSVVVAWEALLFTAVPLVLHVAGVFAGPSTYLAVAGLALVVAVEITAFSSAEMPPWFAVLFVVMTTATVAAAWGIVQFAADYYLGTDLLAGREDLMWDLVAATGVGVLAGVLFELYFDRREPGTADPVGGADG
jgi:hypothetical protein